MKSRARRVTIAAAVIGAAVVAVLVVVHWGAVRDHVEAWHFQLTRETETREGLLDRPIIFSPKDDVELITEFVSPEDFKEILEARAYRDSRRWGRRPRRRVLEQRFPRRAYVVIRDGEAPPTFYWPPGGPCR